MAGTSENKPLAENALAGATTDSYSAFYRRELPAMAALAAAVSGNPLIAEDLAQEALVKAYRNWHRLAGYDKPGAWLRRVTINLALSSRARLKSEVRARLRLRTDGRLSPAPADHREVWDAVAMLPGQQRAAIALFYLEDRPIAEIAEILECEPSTAKVHLHRGRTKLSTMLDRPGGHNHD